MTSSLIALCLLAAAGCGPSRSDVTSAVRANLNGRPDAQELTAFYEPRAHAPAWTTSEGLREEGLALLETLCSADLDGLDPSDYAPAELDTALDRAFGSGPGDERAAAIAEVDVALTSALLRYVDQLSHGRWQPEQLDTEWHVEHDPRIDVVAVARRVAEGAGLETIHELSTRSRGYATLREAVARYREIERAGGWPVVPAGPDLKPGDTGERVRALRERLAASGDLEPARREADASEESGGARDESAPGSGSGFDAAVADAVRRFQTRHGLEATGVVDADTLAQLNVPARDRAAQLAVNLERHRWLPERRDGELILVNIPDFRLRAYRDGREALTMRVIVGQPMNQTPVFADRMTHVVFRPYWNVPESIAVGEILPKMRENPSYLASGSYETVVSEGDGDANGHAEQAVLDESAIAEGRLRIRQRPGNGNALGLVKFMFPNQFNVYLHDTPTDHLFAREERDFSHGCVRVEHPDRLGEFVLGWPQEKVRQAMTAGPDDQAVNLDEPIPVQIVYLTAWVEDDQVHFRHDVYGHDAALREQIETHTGTDDAETCQRMLERAKRHAA